MKVFCLFYQGRTKTNNMIPSTGCPEKIVPICAAAVEEL